MVGSDWNALTVDEGVQDGHGTVGDTGVGVDLLEDCKDTLANFAQWKPMKQIASKTGCRAQ